MNQYNLTYKQYNNRTILIEWPTEINENILKDVINFKNKIVNYNIKVIVDVINTYNSLTIIYTTTIDNIYSEISNLKSIYKKPTINKHDQNYCWDVPVCYDQEFGFDLQEISDVNGIPIDEIIELHTGSIYRVFFIGFLPGFLYLGGLPERLHLKRRSTPRLMVEKGSVGIGGTQTGVYSMQSAGGWNIIGKSPVSFFDLSKEKPCFAKAGDKIKFVPISINEFKKIQVEVAINFYKLRNQVIND